MAKEKSKTKHEEVQIHMPSPSYWPITLAFGLALIAIGVVSSIIVSILGVLVLLTAIAGWALQNRAEGREESHE
jgi:cytochrome c oxidase subunit 1